MGDEEEEEERKMKFRQLGRNALEQGKCVWTGKVQIGGYLAENSRDF